MQDIKFTLSVLGGKSKIDDLLKATTFDRQMRAKTQLKIYMIRSLKKDVFHFICRSSGQNIPDSYQVDVMFANVDDLIKKKKRASEEYFHLSNIKTQCSCEDFKYRYRYLATKGNYVLGLKQYIFPKVTNSKLQGSLCKHQYLVLEKLKKPSFQKIFNRYITNKMIGVQTRIKDKDRLSTLQSSAKSKI